MVQTAIEQTPCDSELCGVYDPAHDLRHGLGPPILLLSLCSSDQQDVRMCLHRPRWLYAGASLLLLAYVGSRFVLEVVLHRAPPV